VIALLASFALAAETWWVPDRAAADALSAATEVWPSVEHVIHVGEVPPDADGWRWDGRTIAVRAGDVQRAAPADDARVAVLLGRTWALHAETPGFESFVPAIPTPPPPAPVAEEVSPPRFVIGGRLGTRTGFAEPSAIQGVRVAYTMERGHVWSALDVYGGFGIPGRAGATVFGAADGVDVVHFDRVAGGLDIGWRGLGRRYVSGWVGPQVRSVQNVLFEDRLLLTEYASTHFAIEAGAGVGLDGRRARVDLAGWARWTAGLPLATGVQLDLWLILNPREA
jgi:hypothetical protein